MNQLSNSQIEDYFSIEDQREHNIIYVRTKLSPLRIDIPEINFMISSRMKSKVLDDDEENQSNARISIKVIDASGKTLSKQPSFKNPAVANYLLILNLTNIDQSQRTSIAKNVHLFELRATSPIGSIISYRILNYNNSLFHIENNLITLSKEALFSKFFRNSYLV